LNHLLTGLFVSAFDLRSQLDLFVRRQQRDFADVTQVQPYVCLRGFHNNLEIYPEWSFKFISASGGELYGAMIPLKFSLRSLIWMQQAGIISNRHDGQAGLMIMPHAD
jgi:hypothetical protein